MTRIKSTEWALREAIDKKKRLVDRKFHMFDYHECSVCGDAIRREVMWRVYTGQNYKYVCTTDARTWEEAYDKARDPNNKGVSYSNSY